MVGRTRLFALAESLGGVESLGENGNGVFRRCRADLAQRGGGLEHIQIAREISAPAPHLENFR